MGKYLMVSSNELSVEGMGQNNFKENLQTLFDKYQIPDEYQKIAIELCIHNIFINADARELIYGYPFDMTGNPIIEKDNKKIVTGRGLNPIAYNNKICKINFQTPIEFMTKEDVFNFYIKMREDGYFKDYLHLFVQLFNLDVDIDLLFDIHEKKPGRRKALKLYKKEIESRNKHE